MRTLYRNGRVHTAAVRGATALLVEDATITWIGHAADAPAAAPGPTGMRKIDLGGALVTPAFVDAHVHTTSTGLTLTGLDLTAVSSLRELLDRVDRVARSSGGRPIIGSGWDESSWPERRPPTRAELDRAAYGGAVYLARVDVHSAIASSALLAAVRGVDGMAGFRADGWLSRDAHDAVRTAAYASLTAGQIHDAQLAALRHAAAVGIACVHEMAGPSISSEADLRGLLELSREQPVPEVIGYWGELFGTETAVQLGALGAGGDLFCDGSIGSHTAALTEPYSDLPESAGALRFDTRDLTEHLRRCAQAGLHAGFHAIGDAAVGQVLDAIDAARGGPPVPMVRIEHAELVPDVARVAAAAAVASMQPMFDRTWGGVGGMYERRLGPERAARMNDFAGLAGAGVPLAFGSDAPVTPLAPWAAVHAAGYPHNAQSAISLRAAFDAHTRGGWRAAGRTAEGALAVGAPATFAVWRGSALVEQWLDAGQPPIASPAMDEIGTDPVWPECVLTLRAGTVIHQAAELVPPGR